MSTKIGSPINLRYNPSSMGSYAFMTPRMKNFEFCCGYEEIGGFLNLPNDWTHEQRCAKAAFDIKAINCHAGIVATTVEGQHQSNEIFEAIGFKKVNSSNNWNTSSVVTLWHYHSTR